MFHIENAEDFTRQLRAKVLAMRMACDEITRGYVTAVFHWVAMETPQWSGNAAANWNFSLGAPDLSVSHTFKANSLRWVPKFSKGETSTVMSAVNRARGSIQSMTVMGPSAFISNAAESLDNQRYIQHLEDNRSNFLRPVNNPGHMLERVGFRAFMGVLSEPSKEALKRLKPGQLSNPGVVGLDPGGV